MCVIFVAEKARPSALDVEAAFISNPDGAGIAWREDGKVKWAKGLDLEQITKRVAETPLPFVAHFRVASVGGVSKWLTHPFEISEHAELRLNGTTENWVLFHNGHWGQWDDHLKQALRLGAGRLRLPTGKWMDSRACAWLSAVYGMGYLELIDTKFACFSPDDIEIFGSPWSIHGPEGSKFMASNSGWLKERANLEKKSKPTGVTAPPNQLALSDGTKDEKLESKTYHTTPPFSMLPGIRENSDSNRTGGSSTADPFRGRRHSKRKIRKSPPSPDQLEASGFPRDIANAYRRGECAWEVVLAASALDLISIKTYRKLQKTHQKRGPELAAALSQKLSKEGILRQSNPTIN